jgi:hypothetical protein
VVFIHKNLLKLGDKCQRYATPSSFSVNFGIDGCRSRLVLLWWVMLYLPPNYHEGRVESAEV